MYSKRQKKKYVGRHVFREKRRMKAEEVSTVMDKNGKSTKKTAAYTYDMLGRITRETKTGREDISYTYDANNNRKQMTIGNKTTAYQYNKNDELLRTDTLHTDTEKKRFMSGTETRW